jgi:16S rRNA (guanine527-N7)-methyltransferase
VEELSGYFALLRRWNPSIRLTGDTSEVALGRHSSEARDLLPFLPETGRVVDVGSGSGFPAIPLAIWRPKLSFTLLEPTAKKVAFLRTCARELGLANVTVRRERDEEHRRGERFEAFDIAVSQATFPPGEWIQRGALLVRAGGVVLAMLGPNPGPLPDGLDIHRTEESARTRAISVFHVKHD